MLHTFRADAPSECPTYSLLLCFFQGSIRNAVLAVAFLSLVEALPALYEASDAIVPEHHFEEHAPMVRRPPTPPRGSHLAMILPMIYIGLGCGAGSGRPYLLPYNTPPPIHGYRVNVFPLIF